MATFLFDLRLACRGLLRRPTATVLAVLSLAATIGFATAAFTVVDAYQWRDLPVRDPAQLVWVFAQNRQQQFDQVTWIEFQQLSRRGRAFQEVVAQTRHAPRVRLRDRDDFPLTAGVSDNYFDMLGVRAAAGTVFHRAGGQDGQVVISDRYWKTALDGDSSVVGRVLEVSGAQFRVIGVLPPDFMGANRGLRVDLFVPSQAAFGSLRFGTAADPRNNDFEILARLKPAVTVEEAQREADGSLAQVERDGLASGPGRRSAIFPFAEATVRGKLSANAVFPATVLLVLLIAAGNIANLRLVQNEARRRETAVRLALGAGRPALWRQHLAEMLVLAGLGVGGGLLLASWIVDLAPAILYAGNRFTDYSIHLDRRALAFCVGAMLLVAFIGTLIPLNDALRRGTLQGLRGGSATRPSRWLAALVVVQIGFATAVTSTAALLWQSLEKVAAIRPAMDPARPLLLVAGFWDATPSAPDLAAGALARQISSLPGVQRVAYARRAPLSGSGGGAAVTLEMPAQGKLTFKFNQVSPNYFATAGTVVLAGRVFTDADGAGTTPVVVVNQAFVRRFFPSAPRLGVGSWIKVDGANRLVVGVVEDGPANHLREPIEPYFFFPFAQHPSDGLTLLVEAGDPASLAPEVRSRVKTAAPGFTTLDVTTLGEHMRVARRDEELTSGVAGALAGLGLLLAGAGLFGVTLFAVSRRTREFGVRLALGASGSALTRQVLREAGMFLAVGMPLGWVLSWAGRKAVQSYLFGVQAGDPLVLTVATAIVVCVAVVAAAQPARRAARIDPMTALREE